MIGPNAARTATLLLASVGLLGMGAAAEPASAPDPFAWPAVTAESKPWTRWWWLGSAVDSTNLTRSLEEFKQVGIGGVEITPIYGVKGSETEHINYLTPKWMDMLAHTTTEGKRLGVGIDMATGTGWPFGGPRVSTEDASARMNMQKYDVAAGATLTGALPRGRLQCLMAVSDAGERIDLTAKVTNGKLDWTAPAGKWRLYAVALDGPIQPQVKRAAPGGEGSVLDPFSVPALNRYLADFDKAFAGFQAPKPRGQFHDSYEYYNASGTPEFFAEFQKRRGYDLREQLPALFSEGNQDTVARVKCDYRETISDLHIAYITRWTEWCHALGFISRNQAHGGPTNLIDAYAASDIPEMEVYRSATERQMPMMKLAAAAAHLSGRNLTSAESFTWLGEHFQVPLSKIKTAADLLFLSGVNHLVYHGTPYSPADAPWPGWQFYAAVNFGPGGGLWHDLPAFNAYVTRVQSVLQAGKPSNDVLLYLPIYDKWQSAAGLMMPFETEGRWMESLPFHATAALLWNRGYGYDVVSDRRLSEATCTDGQIVVGGNTYRTIVIPKVRQMPPATVRKLVDLTNLGATVILQGGVPTDVPGLGDLEKRRGELKELLRAIAPPGETSGDGPVKVGKGSVLVGLDLENLLRQAKVNREAVADAGVRFVRRTHAQGHNYFLANRGDRALDGWVTLGTPAKSATILDPMSDNRAGVAAVRRTLDGANQVYLQLQPGESLVLRTFVEQETPGKPWRYDRATDGAVAISGSWKVQFIDGGPALPMAYEAKELASWTKQDDAEAQRFAGTARYAIEFDRPAGAAADWQLDLGRVGESARVSVNGHTLGTLFRAPFRVAVGEHLKPGRNTLEVEVTNLAANRVRDLDRRKVNWKYFYDANLASHPDSRQRGVLDASNWPLRDSGLLGPVTLIPVKHLSPNQGSQP